MLAASYAARVPVTGIPLALILVVREDGRSYDVAGLATGAYTLALSATAPAIGRLADRVGGPVLFLAGAPVCAAALLALAAGLAGGSVLALLALAVVAGGALPPVGALTRGLLTPLLHGDRRARVFAIDATAQELCFIAGPLLVAGLVALLRPGAALAGLALLLVVGAAGYGAAGRRLARAGRVEHASQASPLRGGGLRAVLVLAILGGLMFGAMELSATAAVDEAGDRDRAGILLGLWSFGSLLGGLAAVRWPVRRPLRRLVASLAACAGLCAALAAVADRPVALVVLLVLHGVAHAPLMAVLYVLVPLVVGSRINEAFAWLTSAVVGGIALGTTVAGSAVHDAGAWAGFLVGALAAALALVAALPPVRRAVGGRDPSTA